MANCFFDFKKGETMNKTKEIRGKKGEIATSSLIGWGIFIAVLILVCMGIYVFVIKGTSAADFINGLIRFR